MQGPKTSRRTFCQAVSAAGLGALLPTSAQTRPRRVAIIGHTGRGNFGHGLDTVWLKIPNVEIVGVADAGGAPALAKACKKLRLPSERGFSDYRKMVNELKPEFVPVTEREWMTLPELDTPLVGREEGLRRLVAAYEQTQLGRTTMVLISGEAGIGKSRLMEEFINQLQGQALILTGAGYIEAQTMPYQPIVEILRSALRHEPQTLNVHGAWLAEASRLLPELHMMHPNLPPTSAEESEEARGRLLPTEDIGHGE